MTTSVGALAALAVMAGVPLTLSGIAGAGRPQGASLRVVRIGEMSVERAAHQATVLGPGRVLITGGCSGQGCDRILAATEIFEASRRSFRAAAPMGKPRASHAAVALADGRVLVCGGWTGRRATASAEIYDPATGRWTAVGEMTEARASPIAVPLLDGRVLVMGGGDGRLGNLASAEVFDPATSHFSAAGPMRTNHYLATGLKDGRVLLTGGQGARGEILRSAEIFDPATGKFRPTGQMAVPRVKHAAARMPDGKVLIIGGSDGRGYRGRTRSTEIFDPATGEFSPGPSMRWGRHKIRDAVTTLRSGAVLVAGGAPRLELYDPTGRVFLPLEGELPGPRMFATATLVSTGDVLILGGYDEHTRPSGSAWIFRSGH